MFFILFSCKIIQAFLHYYSIYFACLLDRGLFKHNVLPLIETVLILKKGGKAVACGCFKPYDKDSVEIKRMFVLKEERGNGYSKEILKNLEKWALELGYKKAVLETGKNQREALGLYERCKYKKVENYGPYIGKEHSV